MSYVARRTEHGTRSRYTHGCRCDECRKANAEYQRRITRARRDKAERDADGHVIGKPYSGTTYVNWMCRCDICTALNSLECRPRREAYRKRQAEKRSTL